MKNRYIKGTVIFTEVERLSESSSLYEYYDTYSGSNICRVEIFDYELSKWNCIPLTEEICDELIATVQDRIDQLVVFKSKIRVIKKIYKSKR